MPGATRFKSCLLLMIVSVLLAACSGGVQPFSKSGKPSGRTPPAIILRTLQSIPADKAKVLTDALTVTAAKRDIAIVTGRLQNAYFLDGEFQAVYQTSGAVVTYRWRLSDAKGILLHEFAGNETGRPPVGDPWSGMDADALRRIAAATAEALANKLAQLGFATQTAGLLPPTSGYARAGPGAEKDIDLETLNGPGYSLAAGTALPPAAAPAIAAPPATAGRTGAQRTARARPAPARPLPPAAQPGKARKNSRTQTINAVALTSVTGSPGTGNADLSVAMARVLRKAGWPVLIRGRADALSISAVVKLKPAAGTTQNVILVWTVKTPQGKVLGTIRQANDVPAGSLDTGWGQKCPLCRSGCRQRHIQAGQSDALTGPAVDMTLRNTKFCENVRPPVRQRPPLFACGPAPMSDGNAVWVLV